MSAFLYPPPGLLPWPADATPAPHRASPNPGTPRLLTHTSSTAPAPAQTVWLDRGEAIDLRCLSPHLHWQLDQGALRVDDLGQALPTPALGLLLARDLLPEADDAPADSWAARLRLQALLPSRLIGLQRAPGDALSHPRALLAQHWARTQDMLRLRRGPVPDRIKQLVLLLAQGLADSAPVGQDDQALRLPRVRDIADLVDSTPESVSRTMTAFKRLDLLSERQGSRTRVNAQRLSASTLPLGLTRSVPLCPAPAPANTPPPLQQR